MILSELTNGYCVRIGVKYLAVFFKSILLGYVCHAFKYFAVFFKSIEMFSSHYSSVFTVPFLRIVRLKDCVQETTAFGIH